jgi:hypothetical protein
VRGLISPVRERTRYPAVNELITCKVLKI